MSWDPRGHRSAQQRAREGTPTQRRLNKSAQLAPYILTPANRCARKGCGDVRLIHRGDHECLRDGCDCPEFVSPA